MPTSAVDASTESSHGNRRRFGGLLRIGNQHLLSSSGYRRHPDYGVATDGTAADDHPSIAECTITPAMHINTCRNASYTGIDPGTSWCITSSLRLCNAWIFGVRLGLHRRKPPKGLTGNHRASWSD